MEQFSRSKSAKFVLGGAAVLAVGGAIASGAVADVVSPAKPAPLQATVPGPAVSGPVDSADFRKISAYSGLAAAANGSLTRSRAVSVNLPSGIPAQAKVSQGANGLCVSIASGGEEAGATSCSSTFSVQPPVIEADNPGQGKIVVGLAPDNVNKVSIKLADGSTGEVKVVNNVYAAVVKQPVALDQYVSVPGFSK